MLRILYLARYLLVLFRKPVFHAQVFELALYRIQTESVCQRHEQIYGLARDLDLLVERHRTQCAHIVQAIGQLYDYHTHIVRQRKQYFTEILSLLRGLGIEYAGHFGQSVDHGRYLRRECLLDVFDRVVGILDHIVQQRGHDGFHAEAYLVYHNHRHGYRVQYIRLARASLDALVSLLGQKECASDEVPILLVLAYSGLSARLDQLVPASVDQYLVFGGVIHGKLPCYVYLLTAPSCRPSSRRVPWLRPLRRAPRPF